MSRNVSVLERDMTYGLAKPFVRDDLPAEANLHRRPAGSYGRADVTLAGYFGARDARGFFRNAARGRVRDPPTVRYFGSVPVRRLRARRAA